jgi:hypothetical protein
MAEPDASSAAVLVRSAPPPGLRTDHTAAHAISAFFGLRLHALDRSQSEELTRTERLAQALEGQRSFLEALLDPSLDLVVDLRLRTHPGAALPIEVALLGRTWGRRGDVVQQEAANLTERIIGSLPPQLRASPIEHRDELARWLAPLDTGAAIDAALLTRREVLAAPQRPDAKVAYYFAVVPSGSAQTDWSQLYAMLSQSPAPIVLSVALLPLELPASYKLLLDRYAMFYARLAIEDRVHGGLYRGTRLIAPDPFAVDAEPVFRDYARRYAGPLFLTRVEVAAERALPAGIAEAVAAAVSPAATTEPNRTAGPWEIRRTRTDYDRQLARWNLAALDLCLIDGDPRIWARADPPPAELASLCVLADARAASAIFRLPIDGDAPGFASSPAGPAPAAGAGASGERPVNPPRLSPGSTFAGYRLQKELGRGGMGVIYLAAELMPARTVALKVVAPDLVGDPTFRERFLRELQAAASLEHPHVVPVLAAGEEDGLLFSAMRFIRGRDLAALIAAEGPLEPLRAANLLDQIADALDAAHGQGMVHRDVKPANVLVETRSRGEHAYLTDFGLTKYMGSTGGLTRSGMVLGTVDYMPPEQLNGDDVDARADVYALGCVLFEALTGRVPYPRGDPVARMYAHVFEPPPRVSDVVGGGPITFDPVIARALAKNPDERYPSAGDLARAMLAAAGMRARAGRERSVATGAAPPA